MSIKKLNKWVEKWSGLINLSGFLIALIALYFAYNAFYLSNQKADLVLTYNVYDKDVGTGNQNENGNGVIVLNNNIQFNGSTDEVTIARPGSKVNFHLENKGDIPAKNPVINFKFHNMSYEMDSENSEWYGISYLHGVGGWSEIQWQPKGEMIHKGIPKNFLMFNFSKSKVHEGAYIEVVISAENAVTKAFTIPVKIENP